MQDNTKVLQSITDETDPVSGTKAALIVHMLPDTLRFLEHTSTVFDIDRIICIPYAVEDEALEQARQDYDVTVPEDIEDLERIAEDYVRSFPEEHDEDLIILEIGGYCAAFLEDIDTSHITAIVEDTNNGHWAYEQIDPDIPVLSIAQSSIKQLENRLVGPAVVFSLEKLLRKDFEDELAGKDVLVTGYGNIGRSTADAVDGRNASAMVHDIDPRKQIEASLDGYLIEEKDELLRKADIIVGTTGSESIGLEDLRQTNGTVVLASGSSKQKEFDIDGLEDHADHIDAGPHWDEYRLDGTDIILLNDGKPINFLDRSISMPVLDMIFGSLAACMIDAATGGFDPGLQDPPQERLDTIATRWLEMYQYSGETR